ncbi:hypothetical protein HMPREF9098_0348 [Kingella denitrificans ATCC 33394]|uniref:Uncharacterized protein n=1 Tax=Kingella denitrificans ATCC 33394 TaxID=888741 RepID=F0EWW8_9NEIS|nr:hypothetical protein HMPREF9098_0348 [Kingella denitrificans ATCC 33394]
MADNWLPEKAQAAFGAAAIRLLFVLQTGEGLSGCLKSSLHLP